MKKSLLLLLLISIFSQNLFADTSSTSTTPKAYDDDEFPQALLDLRRFEIITLGSMPFVMLDTTLAYSAYKYASGKSTSFNFLNSSSYDKDETKKIILTSLGISASIGLTDFIVRLVKRSNANKASRNLYNENLNIYENNLLDQEILEEEAESLQIIDSRGKASDINPQLEAGESKEIDTEIPQSENSEIIEVLE